MEIKRKKWVLVPGTLCTPEVFEPLLDELAVAHADRHFITPDAPHVGDYQDRFRAVKCDGAIVCGFSLGALIVAHNLGALSKASAVVLLASNPFPNPRGNRANREAVRDRILSGNAREWVVENWTSMSTDHGEEIRELVASMADRSTDLITAQTELAASRPGAELDLLETDLPLVFVTGAEDKLTPPEPIVSLAKKAKSAVLQNLNGLGHFALLEAPDRVASALMKGIEEVATSNEDVVENA